MDVWRRYGRVATADVYGLLDGIPARPRDWSYLGSLGELSFVLDGYRGSRDPRHG
jgi:hypothetical protein